MASAPKGNVTTLKVVIPKEELQIVRNKLSCPQLDCNKSFTSSSNLNMHLWKAHKIEEMKLQKSYKGLDNVQFYCPEEGCKYNLENGRFFSKVKLLKQHYLYCHSSKEFKCENCNVYFPTQAARNYHSRSCGCQCVCSCGKIFSNEPALKVHSSRQKHKLPTKFLVKVAMSQTQTAETLPAVQLMAAVALSELCKPVQRDAEVQTEAQERHKKKQSTPSKSPNLKRRQPTTSQQTQTQSTSSSILKKAMIEAKIPVKPTKRKRNTQTQTIRKTPKKSKKSTQSNETQTIKPSTSTMATCTSFEEDFIKEKAAQEELKSNSPLLEVMSSEQPNVINDVALPEAGWINQKSTQTVDFDYPSLETLLSCDYKFQSSETQTDLFDESFLDDCDASFSMNNETQTCSKLNESLENMLYSNMCTQTCDELLSSLDFVDIETQTFDLD